MNSIHFFKLSPALCNYTLFFEIKGGLEDDDGEVDEDGIVDKRSENTDEVSNSLTTETIGFSDKSGNSEEH
ncbi:unnamed protein product [Trichobilharzia regenti]|nr:unnamed protein product [Trichobilharzia regenti]